MGPSGPRDGADAVIVPSIPSDEREMRCGSRAAAAEGGVILPDMAGRSQKGWEQTCAIVDVAV